MAIKWRPAEVVFLHKFCDAPGCGLEMDEQPNLRPSMGEVLRSDDPKLLVYQYRCPNGHFSQSDRLYPRWEVRHVKKKDKVID